MNISLLTGRDISKLARFISDAVPCGAALHRKAAPHDIAFALNLELYAVSDHE